jgi:hypothetical protein
VACRTVTVPQHPNGAGDPGLSQPVGQTGHGERQDEAERGRADRAADWAAGASIAANVRRDLRRALALVPGLNPADWTPRELRHAFVSLLSDAGVPSRTSRSSSAIAAPPSPNWSTGIRSGPSSRPAQQLWIDSSDTANQVRSHSIGHSPGRCGRFGSPEPASDLVGDTGFEPVTSSV